MSQEEMRSFAEFWPHYVAEHSKPATRALHAAGTTLAVACAAALLAKGKWRLLPLAFIPGYAAAWAAHFFIERNRPATFEHPLWSLIADYKMIGLMLTGKMEAEVERGRSESPVKVQRSERASGDPF
jgi:hypothetical protein